MIFGEEAAAATPARTTDRAKMRMVSFIVGNLSWIELAGDLSPDTEKG
jgi:hypothetical protein